MYNDKTKQAIMKWRENNKEEYNDYMREIVYSRHSDKIKEKRMKRYYFQKECKIFRDILF
jgi:hypothetical protein